MARAHVASVPTVASLSWDDCRLLVENVVDYAIFMLDEGGHVATWNKGAQTIKGYTPDEIVGEHFSRFYLEEDRANGKPQRALATATETGRFEDEGWRLRKDGTRFWASVVITALRDERGELRGFAKVTRDLTARRAAEEQLRSAEHRFHQLVDAVIDYAIFMLDTSGRVATWNPGAQRVKGYAPEEIIGQHFSVFYTPEDRAAGKPDHILETVAREGRFEDESWRVRKNGSRFWANVVITSLRDESGNLIGFAKITRDLSARREAEETERRLLREQAAREAAENAEGKLRESEERYRALSRRLEIVLEGVADGITAQDRAGRVVFANGAAARICGFARAEELVEARPGGGGALFEMLDAEGAPVEPERLPAARALAGEAGASTVVQLREPTTGAHRWVRLRANAVHDSEGKPELAISIWHDVTVERRQKMHATYLAEATAALGASLAYNEMLATLARVLVPALADWCTIYVVDGDRLLNVAGAHADPARQAATEEYRRKFRPEEGHASGVWGVIRTGTSTVINDMTDEALARSTPDPDALAGLRTLGMKAALIVPMRVRSRVLGAIALVSTETGRRFDESVIALLEELGRRAGVALENAQLYRAAQTAAAQAEEASRAKDEFLATVSHELRTPLNAIVGWSSMLKETVLDPAVAKPLDVIHRNARAQVKIVDDILDVSRVITGKFRIDVKAADLVAITRDAIEVIRPSAVAKKITIELAPETPHCLLVADPERLLQVVWNLLANAVKFTGTGGTISVAVRLENANAVVVVRDSGHGIDPEFLPHVFERFQQADSTFTRRYGGLGLGLALVRHIVELHGGHVAAESAGVEKGATFTVTLPVRAVAPAHDEQEVPVTNGAARQAPVVLAGVRVLVVDDEPDARELVEAILYSAGAVVETASSAAEGYEAFQQRRPDVLVSDIGMPREDGLSLIRRVRALPPSRGGGTPSLALTAFAREEDRTRAISAGFTTHLGKPVDPDVLTSAVANLALLTPRA